jgi:hypothetical protein
MPELTKEQQRFLIWLSSRGTHFEICRELGYSYRKTNGLERYINEKGARLKFDTRTLQKLIHAGLVTSDLIYPFGIKHERYYVTEEGRACARFFRLRVS